MVMVHEFFPKHFLTQGLLTITNFTKKEEKVSLEETKVTKEKESEIHALEEAVSLCAHCCNKMMFADQDHLLGSKPHNQPLFVLGYT